MHNLINWVREEEEELLLLRTPSPCEWPHEVLGDSSKRNLQTIKHRGRKLSMLHVYVRTSRSCHHTLSQFPATAEMCLEITGVLAGLQF